jgi:hypothetical protein
MKKDFEKLTVWAAGLTAEQMRPLLVELADYAVDSEMVSIYDFAPYWSHTGDPLIEGQKTHEDDDL